MFKHVIVHVQRTHYSLGGGVWGDINQGEGGTLFKKKGTHYLGGRAHIIHWEGGGHITHREGKHYFGRHYSAIAHAQPCN